MKFASYAELVFKMTQNPLSVYFQNLACMAATNY